MCSLTITAPADIDLNELNEKDHSTVEKRMIDYAKEASVSNKTPLDMSPLTDMPPDLKHLRHYRVGDHRVYYIGLNLMCHYKIVHIKINKRAGVNDEHDPKFQKFLAKIINQPTRQLYPPVENEPK